MLEPHSKPQLLCQKLVPYCLKQTVNKPFGQFQNYIADETITNCNVTNTLEDVSTLNIP